MRLGVDAPREPADDDEPCSGELPAEHPRDGAPVRRAGTSPDDGDRRTREELGQPAAPAQPEHGGWVGDRSEQRRIAAARPASSRRKLTSPPRGRFSTPRALTPAGARYDSASARCSGRTSSAAGERGDRPRHPCDSRAATAGERDAFDGPVEQRRGRLRAPQHVAVPEALPRRHHTGPNRGRRLPGRCRQLLGARPRHRDDEVEPVEQRPRDPLPVRRDALRRCRRTLRPGRPARRTDTGSSSQQGGTAPGRAHALRPAPPRRRRPRAAAAATRAPVGGTPAARRAAARRGARGSPRPAAARCLRRRPPPPTHRGAAPETAARG